MASDTSTLRFDPGTTTKPIRALLTYYAIVSCFGLVFFPIIFLPLFCKYRSLRYKFDDAGVSMRWGILFRKEVYLTYRRIQDIHLTRNLLQRWMGLAKISLQTASGSNQAEMAIEGILQPELLRDYLYSQMRGAKNDRQKLAASSDSATAEPEGGADHDRATQALIDIRDALQTLVRQAADKNRPGEPS